MRVGLADLMRIVVGELNPVSAMIEGKTQVEGDLSIASRLVEMFGGFSPVGVIPTASARARRSGGSAACSPISTSPSEARRRGSGEAIKDQHKFFGKTVILAARIAAQAMGEEILASTVVRSLVEPSGLFRFGDTRQLELKGLAGRHEATRVLWSSTWVALAPIRK